MGIFRELASVGHDVGAVFLLIGLATFLPLGVGAYYQAWDAFCCWKAANLHATVCPLQRPPLSGFLSVFSGVCPFSLPAWGYWMQRLSPCRHGRVRVLLLRQMLRSGPKRCCSGGPLCSGSGALALSHSHLRLPAGQVWLPGVFIARRGGRKRLCRV